MPKEIEQLIAARNQLRQAQKIQRENLANSQREETNQMQQRLFEKVGISKEILRDLREDELWELAQFAEEKGADSRFLLAGIRLSFYDCERARLRKGELLYDEAPADENAGDIYKKAMILINRSVPGEPGPMLSVAKSLLLQAAEREEEPRQKILYQFLSENVWIIHRYRKEQFWTHY